MFAVPDKRADQHTEGKRAIADVFISYASEDREFARRVATAIEREGWSVWWDRQILAGRTFDREIERELDGAGCIVVLWSSASIDSEWVRNEAARAAEREVLVPARIEDVRPPLEFRRKQTADLIAWTGERSHAGFAAVTAAIAAMTKRPSSLPDLQPPPRTFRNKRGLLVTAAALLLAIALIAYWMSHERPHDETAIGQHLPDKPAAPKTAQAADSLSGRWEFEPNAKRRRMFLDLKLSGGRLFGREVIAYPQDPLTLASGLQRAAAILDGNFDGKRISFLTKRRFTSGFSDDKRVVEAVHRYDGRLDGDRIRFTFTDEQSGEVLELTAIRQSDFAPAEIIGKLEGHRGYVEQMALLPDGRLASAARDQSVRIWNLTTGKAESVFEHESRLEGIVAIADGRLAAAEQNGLVTIWNPRAAQAEAKLPRRPGELHAIAALADGRLVGGYSSGEIAIWNVSNRTLDKTIKAADAAVLRLAALPDGRIAAGDASGTVQIWDPTGDDAPRLVGKAGGDGAVSGLVTSADGRLAFTTARSHDVSILSLATGNNIEQTLPITLGQRAEALAFLPGGPLAVLESEARIVLWNAKDGKRLANFEVASDTPYEAAAILPLGNGRLAVALGDGAIALWKLR